MQPTAEPDLPSSFRFLKAYYLVWQTLAATAATNLERCLRLDVRGLIILSYIAWGHDNSPSDLSRKLQLSKYTVTRALDRLEALGAIERSVHPRDGRRARLTLTPSGARLHGAAIIEIERTLGATLAPFTEVPHLVRTLEALLEPRKGTS